jgi:hypothetical protein
MNEKLQDENFHIWSPSCFWGDQMFNLMAARRLSNGKPVFIHTWRNAWSGHTQEWLNMDHNILQFWAKVGFIKGIIFDIDQYNPIDVGCERSEYPVHMTLLNRNELSSVGFTYDISNDIDFSSFPAHQRAAETRWLGGVVGEHHRRRDTDEKIAVFQPISILHKRKEDIELEYSSPWDQCIEALLDKEYKIVAIGSDRDIMDVEKYYPNLLNKYPIENLMGRTSMFESIDLVMNYASFVLSCDSWSAWYGISSRVKTAVAVGRRLDPDHPSSEWTYVQALGNEDIYKLDYAYNKEECDTNLANWIKDNA